MIFADFFTKIWHFAKTFVDNYNFLNLFNSCKSGRYKPVSKSVEIALILFRAFSQCNKQSILPSGKRGLQRVLKEFDSE